MSKVFNVFDTATGRLVKVRTHFGGTYEFNISKNAFSIFNTKKNRVMEMPVGCLEELRYIINSAKEHHGRIMKEESVLPLLGTNVSNFACYNHFISTKSCFNLFYFMTTLCFIHVLLRPFSSTA